MHAFLIVVVATALWAVSLHAGELHLIAREPITHPPQSSDLSPLSSGQFLTWDDPNEFEVGVAGYIVYERIGVDWFVLGKSGLERLFEILPDELGGLRSVRTFAVTAFNYSGETFQESDRSEELDVRPGD